MSGLRYSFTQLGSVYPYITSGWGGEQSVDCHLTTHSPLNTHCTTLHHQGIYKGNYKDFLMNILTKKESLTILDAACGTGVN